MTGILTLVVLLMLAGPSFARSVSVEVEDYGNTRHEAEARVLEYAVMQGLTQCMDKLSKDEAFRSKIRSWIKELEHDHYKPLVRRWRFDIDMAKGSRHYLQGKVVLDSDTLELFCEKLRPPKIRLSAYLIPWELDETLAAEDRALREQFLHALERRLISLGWSIKREAQHRQAQYRLQIVETEFDREALNGSVAFTVQALDNRTDQSLFNTMDGYATASLSIFTTESALRKELLQRASQKVSRELTRRLLKPEHTEIVFYVADGKSKRRIRNDLLDGLAELYGIDDDDVVDAIDDDSQTTDLKGGGYMFSFLIPPEYKLGRRKLENGLTALQQDLFRAQKADARLGKSKWLVFDERTMQHVPPAPEPVQDWARVVEALIQEGKLDSPPGLGRNAAETVKWHMSMRPNNRAFVDYLQRISGAFVTLAYDAMDKEQIPQAARYLDRAQRVFAKNPDILKARQQLEGMTIPTAAPTQHVGQVFTAVADQEQSPQLVFPQLEAKLRGLSRVKQSQDKKIVGLVADADGIMGVSANGQALPLHPVSNHHEDYLNVPDADVFEFKVPLSAADDKGIINITATDNSGSYTSRRLEVKSDKVQLLLQDDGVVAGRNVIERGHYWALLIANQEYTEGPNPLQTPHRDVDELQKVLVGRYGFDPKRVTVVKDATKLDLEKALNAMHHKVKSLDSLLIYYAGHGYQDKGFGGLGFWIPVDGKSPDLNDNAQNYRLSWLPNSDVHNIIQASRAKHVLLISDSCYSGSFKTRSIGDRQVYAASMDFIYRLAGKESRRAITAGDLEPVSDGGADGHSIFAYYLIEKLKQADAALNAEHLYQQLRVPVQRAIPGFQQHPQYFRTDKEKDKGGDFIFVPKN